MWGSVLGAVVAALLVISVLAGLIGARALQMADGLPVYQATLEKNWRSLRIVIVHVVEALDGAERDHFLIQQRRTVLDEASSGRLLREKRMLRQPTGNAGQVGDAPIVLCIGKGLPGDDLATEILVRLLRGLRMDARHLTVEDLESARYFRAPAAAICLVTMSASEEAEAGVRLARRMRSESPQAHSIALLLPGLPTADRHTALREAVDTIVSSYAQAMLELQAHLADLRSPRRHESNHLSLARKTR